VAHQAAKKTRAQHHATKASVSTHEIEIQAPPHVMHYLNATGDTRTTWDPENADEVAAAVAQFDDLKKKGFLAYSVKPGGEPDKLLRRFDPQAGKIIMKPPMAGG
jgi:hypothetical protein